MTPLVQRRSQALENVAKAAAHDVAYTLRLDSSLVAAALNVEQMMTDIFMSVLQTVPVETAKKDGKDWELWSNVMAELGVPAWRGNVTAHRGHDVAGYWHRWYIKQLRTFAASK